MYLNDGTGSYADASSQLPGDAPFMFAVALADLDRDGDLDAVLGKAGGVDTDRLYENQGDGWYTDVSSEKLPPSGSGGSIGVGDFDGNGWPDLLLGGVLRLNYGGVFLDVPGLAPQKKNSFSTALGDLDGDGDLDALLDGSGNDGRPLLWRNLLRQTVRRGPARAGKPFALELRGEPLANCVVAFAAGSGDWPVPPFGTLLLDPSALHVAGATKLDVQGRANPNLAVPADPAGVGATLHFQSFTGQPPLFTNREAVTLTNW